MNLPFLKSEKPQKNFFLSLLYKPYKSGAILFEEINSKLFILGSAEQESTKSTDELTSEELLNLSDKVISSVEPNLPEGANVEKTIFSVPYEWIDEGKIKTEYLDKLKKVCQDLGLIPVGYLISIEAVISHLEHKEGAPVSAIFVEVGAKKIIVYLVRAGKILEVHAGSIEKGVLPTVESLFRQFTKVDVLPSRIILLDYKNAQAMQQDFIAHVWSEDIAFLHIPQVLVLEKGFEDEAAVNGVAIQMDLEVLHDKKAIKKVENETVEESSDIPPFIPEETDEKKEEVVTADAEEFGFMKDTDVADLGEESVIGESELKVDESEVANIKEETKKSEEPNITFYETNESEGKDVDPETPDMLKGLPFLATLPKIKIPSFSNVKIPAIPSIPFFKSGSAMKIKIAIGLGILVLGVILLSFLYYNFILETNVSVFSDKREVNKTAEVTFSENPTSDSEIKISITEETQKGDDTKSATGTKDTGDLAKGTVTIYNKTEGEKSFSKGTIVVGPNNLEFETQSDIKIASTSAFSTSISSASVKVNAAKFGKEYNLPSGSNFTVKGSSTSNYIAKNSDAFSGGTKKTTTVVSQKDLDDLLNQVESKLEKQAVEAVKQKVGNSSGVIPTAIETSVVNDEYTKKVGAESSEVGISADIKYSIGSYSNDDLKTVVKGMADGIPPTYKIDMDNSKIEVTDIKIDKDGKASAKLKVSAVYIPEIDSAKLISEIKGKAESSAVDKIKDINGVTDVVVNFSRKLPLFPNLLPANSKNINVEIKK